jgi:hypothetical protein
MPDMGDMLEHMWKKKPFKEAAFGLDGLRKLPNTMNRVSILPIVAYEIGDEEDKFLFHGLLLHNFEELEGVRCYHRIGFAHISRDGSIAGSEFYVDGWTSPPWPAEELQTIRLK